MARSSLYNKNNAIIIMKNFKHDNRLMTVIILTIITVVSTIFTDVQFFLKLDLRSVSIFSLTSLYKGNFYS